MNSKLSWISAAVAVGSMGCIYSQMGVQTPLDEGSQLFLHHDLSQEEVAFVNYSSQFGKNYKTKEEYKFRFEQFKRTLKQIESHDETFYGSTVGLNAFSDFTQEEKKQLLGLKEISREDLDAQQVQGPRTEEIARESDPNLQIKTSVDWRDEGVVQKPKNQGTCGSCWAFAAQGALESAVALKTGKLYNFSEQQIVDCVRYANCNGCKGGHMYYVWKKQQEEKMGSALTSAYPYTGKDTSACQDMQKSQMFGFVQSYDWVDKSAIMLKVRLNYRPVAVTMEGENDFFYNYRSGVIKQGCGTNVDHAVLAVGYGQDKDGQEYFIIKNSWGSWWGESGYARIAPDQCGITLGGIGVYAE